VPLGKRKAHPDVLSRSHFPAENPHTTPPATASSAGSRICPDTAQSPPAWPSSVRRQNLMQEAVRNEHVGFAATPRIWAGTLRLPLRSDGNHFTPLLPLSWSGARADDDRDLRACPLEA
jgi:hypothetical protein